MAKTKSRLTLKAELTEEVVNCGITNFLDLAEIAKEKDERYFAVVVHNVEYFQAIINANKEKRENTTKPNTKANIKRAA